MSRLHFNELNRYRLGYRAEILLIVAAGLLFQGLMAARLHQPSYMDAYYYTTNGRRLAEGHGFTERIIWQYLDQPEAIPTPSHTYWMPLPSMMAALGYQLGSGFWAAQLPFWLLAGLLPLLSYAISRRLSGQLWQARTAALLTASGGFYLGFFGQPTTFAPFAWAGALCLFALFQTDRRASSTGRRPSKWWLLAGLMAGLGHLTRADGALLLIVGLLLWLAYGKDRPRNLLWLLAGYLIIMGGWFARNWLVLGRPLSTVGTQTIFLTTYDDLFAYGRSFNLSHLLDWGWRNILLSRLKGLSIAGQTFIAVSCFMFLAPFILWAWLRLWRDLDQRSLLRPMTWYATLLFLTMSLVFTLPGGRGGLFHSSAALWPWFMALAAKGIDLAVDWLAQRLPHWQPERAKRIFAALFVIVAFFISAAIALARTPDGAEAKLYAEIGATLPEDAIVMVGNAPGFNYHTGRAAVSVPNEPVEGVLAAAQAYHVTYLILDQDRPQPLASLYAGDLRHPRIQPINDFHGRKLFHILEPGAEK